MSDQDSQPRHRGAPRTAIEWLRLWFLLRDPVGRREYAIRLALGCAGTRVRWMVVRQALLLAGTGVAMGLLFAASGTRVLQGLLQGVQPLDTPTFAVSSIALISLAAFAAWLPARRAERVDPVETLRAE